MACWRGNPTISFNCVGVGMQLNAVGQQLLRSWTHLRLPKRLKHDTSHSVTVWAFQSVVLLLLTDGIMNVDWTCFHLSINSRNYFCLFSKPNIKDTEGPETFHTVCLHVIDLGCMNVNASPFHHMSKRIQQRCLSVLCVRDKAPLLLSSRGLSAALLWNLNFSVCEGTDLYVESLPYLFTSSVWVSHNAPVDRLLLLFATIYQLTALSSAANIFHSNPQRISSSLTVINFPFPQRDPAIVCGFSLKLRGKHERGETLEVSQQRKDMHQKLLHTVPCG